MNRLNKQDLLKRDNLIVEILKRHRGLNNVISTKQVSKELAENGYDLNVNTLPEKIKQIAFERNLPICASNTKGYYWASCRADLEHTIADLQGFYTALQEHIEHLQQFFIY